MRITSAAHNRLPLVGALAIRASGAWSRWLDRVALRTSQDILAALPGLPVEPFSTRELAVVLGCSTQLAQRTLYCLRTIGIVEPAGKRGHAPLYSLTD